MFLEKYWEEKESGDAHRTRIDPLDFYEDSFVPFWIPGITNYEEYSVIQEMVEDKKDEGTATLKKDRTLLRDERKMEKLKAKLHTDDDRKSPKEQ